MFRLLVFLSRKSLLKMLIKLPGNNKSILIMFPQKYESSNNAHSFGIKAVSSKAESFLRVGKYFHVFIHTQVQLPLPKQYAVARFIFVDKPSRFSFRLKWAGRGQLKQG